MEHLIPVKKQGGHGLFQIFADTTGGSATNDENTMMYTNRLPDIAETSPRGHPDLRRGSPNSPHAGEARWNPNCSAEAKTEQNEFKKGEPLYIVVPFLAFYVSHYRGSNPNCGSGVRRCAGGSRTRSLLNRKSFLVRFSTVHSAAQRNTNICTFECNGPRICTYLLGHYALPQLYLQRYRFALFLW